MKIDAPFSITVIENTSTGSRELHLKFDQNFINQEIETRTNSFNNYLTDLETNLQNDLDERNYQGIQTIYQIAKQLQAYIINDELDLEEKIIIETETSTPLGNLINNATIK